MKKTRYGEQLSADDIKKGMFFVFFFIYSLFAFCFMTILKWKKFWAPPERSPN